MLNLKKIFTLITILIFNLSIASAEEEYVQPEAQKILDEIDELSRTDYDAKKNIDLITGKAYILQKNFSDNKIVLRKIYNALAQVYTQCEKYDFAKKYLNLSYQINPNHYSVYFYFGLLEYKLKNYDKSTEYYIKSIEISPDNKSKSNSENNIGVNYKEQKNFSESIKHLTASINYFPTALTYRNRGDIFADEMKDYSTAIMDYNKAIELDGKYLDAYWNRASAYYNLKNYSSALKDYKKVLELDATKNQVLFQIAYCYGELKNYTAAVESYTKYLYYFPEDKFAYNNRGNACEKIGDYATAIANFTQAILIDSSYGQAYYNRGRVYKKLGKTEQAEQDFSRARQLGYNR